MCTLLLYHSRCRHRVGNWVVGCWVVDRVLGSRSLNNSHTIIQYTYWLKQRPRANFEETRRPLVDNRQWYIIFRLHNHVHNLIRHFYDRKYYENITNVVVPVKLRYDFNYAYVCKLNPLESTPNHRYKMRNPPSRSYQIRDLEKEYMKANYCTFCYII